MENDVSNYLCKNAGLMICHPFLPQLFSNLNYLNESRQFKDADATLRAVLLMQFIATGAITERNDAELAFPKIFCGMPMDHPIQNEVVLSAEEQHMATEMLERLMAHWLQAGKVSIEGLREVFLRRNAMLTKNDTGYKLIVKRMALDILLISLPWSIHVVKLPWNSNYFFVEWG
ncbi:contractile injection system tape measure protein [Microbacter margulisiae]|nr:contractile injection system tape measure protein [Microbacter margulisiae]